MKVSYLLVAILCWLPRLCWAQGNIATLTLNNDIVVFKLVESDATASAPCSKAENQNTWTLALNTPKGQAAYVMLMSSVATDVPVVVKSANDCGDIAGISRADSVKMVKTN